MAPCYFFSSVTETGHIEKMDGAKSMAILEEDLCQSSSVNIWLKHTPKYLLLVGLKKLVPQSIDRLNSNADLYI